MSKLLNRFKKHKNKVEPRAMTEIQAEYVDLRAKAGEVQYQLYVHTKGLATLNARLESLNYEANDRQKLDKQAAATETPQTVEA